MPILSIIVPRKHETLEQSPLLKSLEEQDYNFSDIEIVIGCSSPGETPLDLSSLPKVDSVTRQIFHTDPYLESPSESRNVALDNAIGTYVCFWDIDDTLYSNQSLSDLIQVLVNNKNFQRIRFNSRLIDYNGNMVIPGEPENPVSIEVWDSIFSRNFLNLNNIRFSRTRKRGEDTEFMYNFFRAQYWDVSNPDVFLDRDEVIYVYHMSNSGACVAFEQYSYASVDLMRNLLNNYQDNTQDPSFFTWGWVFSQQITTTLQNLNRLKYPYVYQQTKNVLAYFLSKLTPQRMGASFHQKSYGIRNFSSLYELTIRLNVTDTTPVFYIQDFLDRLLAQRGIDFNDIFVLITYDTIKPNINTESLLPLQDSIQILSNEEFNENQDNYILSYIVSQINYPDTLDDAFTVMDWMQTSELLYKDEVAIILNPNTGSFLARHDCLPIVDNSSFKKKEKPILSIVIPYHNESQDVYHELFNSLNNQQNLDFQNIEILICRGDGENNFPDISKYSNLSSITYMVLRNEVNGSPGMNRELGVRASTGKYIAFLDIDDEIFDSQIIFDICNFLQSNSDVDVLDMPFMTTEGNNEFLTPNTSPFQLWASIYKKDFLDKNNIHFTPTYYGEDLSYVIQIASSSPIRKYLNKCFYRYKLREGSAVTVRFSPEKLQTFVTDIVNIYFDLLNWNKNANVFKKWYTINIVPLLANNLSIEALNGIGPDIKQKCITKLQIIIEECDSSINLLSQFTNYAHLKNNKQILENIIKGAFK